MKPNPSKILEAILFVIEEAERSRIKATQFDIAKTIFLADYRHLQEYGRPVTYDNFVAMKFGPVPSLTYDMLKPTFNWAHYGLQQAPWKTERVSGTTRNYCHPERPPNLRKLSETDVNKLRDAFKIVKAMGFKKTSDFTHKLPAYLEAWQQRGDNKAKDMDIRRLLPEFDAEMIDDLQLASRFSK